MPEASLLLTGNSRLNKTTVITPENRTLLFTLALFDQYIIIVSVNV